MMNGSTEVISYAYVFEQVGCDGIMVKETQHKENFPIHQSKIVRKKVSRPSIIIHDRVLYTPITFSSTPVFDKIQKLSSHKLEKENVVKIINYFIPFIPVTNGYIGGTEENKFYGYEFRYKETLYRIIYDTKKICYDLFKWVCPDFRIKLIIENKTIFELSDFFCSL
jgi:hypothetical protein